MSTKVRTGTIVIVEDDPFIASFLGAVILHGTPYRPHLFSRAGDALAQMRRHKPDLLVLDDHLPDMAGIAFYDQVRVLPERADVPALLISVQPPFGELARRELAYLTKPFHLTELLAIITTLLNR
jgi:DNA-binding response OmpR family regulator